MAVRLDRLLHGVLDELRIHPVRKRVRALHGDTAVVDSTHAVIVWEPRRVVASYAVPVDDVAASLVPYAGPVPDPPAARPGRPLLLDPRVPFGVHLGAGTPLTLRGDAFELPGAAFRSDDPDLAGHVLLDWDAFTTWLEEDEPVMGHPHDPFDRIDCRRSSRHVVVAHGGHVLADTTRATFLFETPLPTRFYIPREDVRMDLLTPSESTTVCAYKGRASYWSATLGGESLPDIAWSYEQPLLDAEPVKDHLAFFDERLDVTLDGQRLARPVTPWS
ncbi:hypothetical protein N864_14990 [Intrasporangium chromatireducens Q5-1]|uniref:DUF427 domain-containing protein n=1 Tax=Intrasporangium chromatireducens Q5-1 TaxID=584657 RepID=W9GGE2_9MICO|nr:DUF427 domain-containing protein [Intrasporangium chromatireducens]EWT04257.1 hypothetical protein N864_14990 [Intrasporangium chromatireducens Q5-1]